MWCARVGGAVYNVGFKTLLQKGLSEPKFYGDLICTLSKMFGKTEQKKKKKKKKKENDNRYK